MNGLLWNMVRRWAVWPMATMLTVRNGAIYCGRSTSLYGGASRNLMGAVHSAHGYIV